MSIFTRKNNIQSNEKPFLSVIIVAAGNATRMGGIDKQFVEICGKPVLLRTALTFAMSPYVNEIIIATKEENIPLVFSLLKENEVPKIKDIICGGATRAESVQAAIQCVSPNSDFIAIHDGARPLVTQKIIEDTYLVAIASGAAATGVPVKDTIKIVNAQNQIVETPPRETLWAVHTPQIFSTIQYKNALASVSNSKNFTDDCKLMEAAGSTVTMVQGEYENLKITTPEDVALAETILKGRENDV